MTKRNHQQPTTDHLAQNHAFLREVDEAMHMDRMTELWLKYRTLLFVTLGAVFCTFAAYEYYNQSHETKLQVQAEEYWTASNQNVGENAVQANFTRLAEDGASGYRLLAQFQIAQQFVRSGSLSEAAKIYGAVAADDKVQPIYQDLAKFYQGQVQMSAQPEEAAGIFSVLVEANSAFKASSLEMLGNLSENKNDTATAKAYYERAIIMPSLSTGLRTRVQARLDVINRMEQNS